MNDELVSRLIDACARGEENPRVAGRVEVSSIEAAALLGMSPTQVRKLMEEGLLDVTLRVRDERRGLNPTHVQMVRSVRDDSGSEDYGRSKPFG